MNASRGYHFAALTSFSATGSTFTSLVVIEVIILHDKMTTKLVNVDPVAEKDVNAAK